MNTKENDMADEKPFDVLSNETQDIDTKKEEIPKVNDTKKEEIPKVIEEKKTKEKIVKEEKPKQEEIKYGGKKYVTLKEGKRYWIDFMTNWDIYKGETRVTPVRWSKHMKKAVLQGMLIIGDDAVKGKPRLRAVQHIRQSKIINDLSNEIKNKTIINSGKTEEMKFEAIYKNKAPTTIKEKR